MKAQTFYVTVDKNLKTPRIYYCDLHVHSEDTIGTNSTRYNLTYGRDVSGLDVLAFAHNDFNITTERWNKTVELIRQITKDGSFVAYPGTEWCGSSCAGGDHNVIFLHDQDPEFPYLKTANMCARWIGMKTPRAAALSLALGHWKSCGRRMPKIPRGIC